MFKSLKINKEKLKFFLFLFLVVLGVVIISFTKLSKLMDLEYLRNYLEMKESIGMVIFLLFFVIRPLLPVPFALMSIAAGFAFGKLGGFLISFLGAFIGMTVEFYISRMWGADFIEKKLGKRGQEVIALANKGGVFTVIILRMVPFISHFDTLNYLLGITKMNYRIFVIGSMFGILPWVILFTLFGDSVRTSNRPILITSAIVIPLLGMVALFIYRRVKREKIGEKH